MSPEGADAGPGEGRRLAVPVFAGGPVSMPFISAAPTGEPTGGGLPLSPEALAELKTRLDQCQDELVSESRRIARRHQADVVSPAYVRQARDHLGTGTRRRTAALAGSLGWAMLGAALPAMFNLGSSAPAAPWQHLWSNVIGMVGAILITVQFLRD